MTTFLESQLEPFEVALKNFRERHLQANKRRDQTAIDVPAALWLCQMCEHAWRVLELGSGFSSWALRMWKKLHPKIDVWTVDDESRWLETTRIELTALKLDTRHVMTLAELRAVVGLGPFDVVFVDMDSTSTRVQMADEIVRWTRSGGLIVLDDWQMEHYSSEMTKALAKHDIDVIEQRSTIDKWGRFLAYGYKP